MPTAKCWSVEANNPHPDIADGTPASNDYRGGFERKLMLKDLGLLPCYSFIALRYNSSSVLSEHQRHLQLLLLHMMKTFYWKSLYNLKLGLMVSL